MTLAAAAFLLHQLMAWPPHEDETLALFVGRDSLAGVVEHVTRDRGGAPLHFLVAWAVAHLGLGLGGLRLASAAFALASLPLVAILGRRLAGPQGRACRDGARRRRAGCSSSTGCTAGCTASSLLCSLACTLALLEALEHGSRRRWGLWVVTALLVVATHPYGVLCSAARRRSSSCPRAHRLRAGGRRLRASVLVLGIPFWLTDLVLADRFDVGVGGGGEKLGGPWASSRYLWRSAGDSPPAGGR